MHTQTSQKAELFARALRTIVLGVLAMFVCATILSLLKPSPTEAATSSTVNFQARLQSAAGAIAPDGNYNISFHLFNSSTAVGGTSTDSGCGTDTSCEWTEIYLNNNSQGVRVANGYLTVNLGSITAFSGINWDQQQWLTMDIGNTNATCTPFSSCSPDGQMSPRLLLTATPYAFSAGQLALTSGSNRVSLQLTTPTVVSELITLPDAPGGSATVCYQTSTACGFAASSGASAAFIQGGNAFGAIAELGNNSAFALNFRTNNTDKLQLDTSGNLILQQASTLNIASAATGTQLTIQGGAATSGTNAGGTLLLQGGAGASTGASGSVIVKSNTNNSTTAFQVQNAAGTSALTVDTINSQLQLRNLNDAATQGAELFGNCPQTFTSAGGWTIPVCSGSATATHTGTANGLTASPAITPTSGASYKVTYTISGYGGSGNVTAKVGGVSGATNSANGTFTDYIFTTGTGNLTFTPTTGFTGTISSVLVEQMINQTPTLVLNDSTGADAAELRVSTSANSNIGLGYRALTSTVAGVAINNTALGAFSLDFVTTGSNNTGVGNGALDNTTIGSANTAIGNASQSFNVSGHDNTSLGALALNGNATGNNNTALGSSALFVGTGSSNSALGFSALKATTSGTGNTALGTSSGRSITTGSTNVFLGTQSGYQDSTQADFQTLQSISNATLLGANTQATCSTCIIIGGQGANAMTGTGGSGVGIGTPNPSNFFSAEPMQANAGTVATTGSSATVTGTGTSFTAAMIGSEIYIASNTNTTATYKGTITAVASTTSITVSPVVTAGLTLSGAHYYVLYTGLQVTAAGNIGIQTLTPQSTLDVNGSVAIGSYAGTNAAPSNGLIVSGQTLIGASSDFADSFGPHQLYVASADGKNAFAVGNTAGTVQGSIFVGASANDPFQFGSITNSNVGVFVNNTPPKWTFNTNGGFTIGSQNAALANGLYVASTGGNQVALNTTGSGFGFISNPNNSQWALGYGASISGASTPVLSWNSSGQVGINTTSVDNALTVAGKIDGSGNTGGVDTSSNLLPNAGFDSWASATSPYAWQSAVTSNWNTGTNVNREPTNVFSPPYAAKLGDGTNTGRGMAMVNSVRVIPSASYMFKAKIAGGDATAQYILMFKAYQSDGVTEITTGSPLGSNFTYSPTYGSWQLNNTVGTTSFTDVIYRLDLSSLVYYLRAGIEYYTGGTTSDYVYVDDVALTHGTLAPAFAYKPLQDTGNQALYNDLAISTASTTAFQVQNAAGTALLNYDTTNQQLSVRNLNDAAVAGSEMFGGFGAASGWTLSGSGASMTAQHTTVASTTAVAASPSLSILGNTVYRVVWTVSGRTAGSVTVTAGSVNGSTVSSGTTTTTTDYITTTAGTNLSFTPASNFDGTISSVSVMPMSSQTPSLLVKDSTGATAAELRVGTAASGNLALGINALMIASGAGSSNGSNNVAIGDYALQGNTSGFNNTAVGVQALSSTTTGNHNTAVGRNALIAMTTGYTSTAIGEYALGGVTTGGNNSAIGYYAGYHDNLQSDFQTSSTIIGATLVGQSAQATCSNCIVLGGQGADAVTGIGIGTPSPTNFLSAQPLEFNGSGGTVNTHSTTTVDTLSSGSFTSSMIGSEIYIASNSTTTATYKGTITAVGSTTSITVSPAVGFTLTGAHFYVLYTGLQVTATGNVGIGTTAPAAALDISYALSSGVGTSPGLIVRNTSAGGTNSQAEIQLVPYNNGGGGDSWTLSANDDFDAFRILDNTAVKFTIDNTGQLGLGTSAPTASLSFVDGADRTVNVMTQTASNTAGNKLTVNSAQGNGSGAGGQLTLQAGTGGATGNGGAVVVQGGTGGATSGIGGNATLQGGIAVGAFAGGTATVQGGTAAATAGSNGGAVAITAANGTGTGTGGNGGAVTITAGNGQGSGNKNGGNITIQAGSAVNSGTIGSVIVKNAANSTAAFQVQNASSGVVLDVDTSNGWVGVGTTATAAPLTVIANAVDTANGSIELINGNLTSITNSTEALRVMPTLSVPSTTTLGYAGAVFGVYSNDTTHLTNAGMVGLQTNPFYDVSTAGTLGLLQGVVANLTNNTASGTVTTSKGLTVQTANNGNIGTNYGIYVGVPTGTGTITNNYALVTEPGSGNVGIGTTTPGASLDLASGTIQGAGLSSDCSATGQKLLWSSSTKQFSCGSDRSSTYIRKSLDQTVNNSTGLVNDGSFSYAIGANETWVFQLYTSVKETSTTAGFKYNFTAPAGATCNLFRTDAAGSSGNFACAATGNTSTTNGAKVVEFFGVISTGATSGTVQFQWAQNSAEANNLTVEAGSFLLGYRESGADYAETYYTKDMDARAGDVVSIDGSIHAGFARSQEPYDHKLLGVVSTQPGQVIGDASTDGVPMPIALAGRVPVKVSTENGPIQPGDPLTSSSVPGVAMRATGPGYVLGKALTGYDNPDPTAIGGVIVFMNLSWADPSPQAVTNNASPFSSPITQQAIFKADTDSASAFQIQNTQGQVLLSADTANMKITVGNLVVTGTLSLQGHFVTTGSVQGAMALPAAGVDAGRANDAVCSVTGNDTSGGITLTAGSEQMASGAVCTITFANPFDTVPHTMLSATDQESLEIGGYLQATPNTMTLYFSHPPQAHHRYNFNYWNPQ